MANPPSVLSLGGPLSPSEFDKRWIGAEGAALYERAEKAHELAAEKQEALAKRFEERRPKEEAESERAYAGVEKAMAQPRPPVPRMERVESPPKPEDYHKMSMGYLGAMVLLGAFGGKFIRNAANAPLAAFNGALTGWQEGNLEAYKEKSAEWKEKQQQVLDNNQARLDEYRTILDDRNASIQDQMLRVRLTAAKHQDKLWYDRADAENYTGIGQLLDQSVAVHERAQAATDKLVERYTKTNDIAVERANLWKAHLATPQGQQELAQLNRRSPGAAFEMGAFVERWADKDAPAQLEAPGPAGGAMPTEPPPGTPMPTGAAGTPGARMPPEFNRPYPPPDLKGKDRSNWYFEKGVWEKEHRPPRDEEWGLHERMQHPGRSVVADELAREDARRAAAGEPPMTREEEVQFEADRRYATSAMGAAGSQAGKMATGIAAFKQSLPLASQASSAVGARSKWVPYNQLKQSAALMRSDPAYGNFVIANEAAVTDYALAIGRGGGMTVHAQERAEKVLNTARNDAAYQSGLRQLEREANAIANAPAEAKRVLLHQLFPNAPQAAVEEAVTESVLPPAGRAPVRVSTPEEAAKLPPGTPYVNPQGDHFTR